ncbi:MAG: hypothetical protein GY858_05045 [Candidatus Omnitrophica bacterium]|nr:hypothetical protein [Candidatus Omnitrophota bacterium]
MLFMRIKRKGSILYRTIISCIIIAIATSLFVTYSSKNSQSSKSSINYAPVLSTMPAPGELVTVSPDFTPAIIKGIKIDPNNPLRFDFIVDTGDSELNEQELKKESTELIKYFLATLTTPKEDLWVNLSPYEKERIIPEKFGQTNMGRDLLAQDYTLKQLMASLTYPDSKLGKEFWNRVYAKVEQEFGTTSIPMNTFNKVWIIPEKAVVHESGNVAFVVESHLKVMLEEDYVALRATDQRPQTKDRRPEEIRGISSKIMREIVLPEIEKEINQGKNFVKLRQAYHSMILATWFKRNFKQGLLGQSYADKSKVAGIDIEDKAIKEEIYQQYIEAYKKGVYDYIKKEHDPYQHKTISRRYFSGGFEGEVIADILIGKTVARADLLRTMGQRRKGQYEDVSVHLDPVRNAELEQQTTAGKQNVTGVSTARNLRRKEFAVSEETFEYLGISEEKIIEMFDSLGELSLSVTGKKYLKDLIKKPLGKRQAIISSHNAIAELLELDEDDSSHLGILHKQICALEKLINNLVYPAIVKKQELDKNDWKWRRKWHINHRYPMRDEQRRLIKEMDLHKRIGDFPGRYPNFEKLTQSQIDEFIYFDLQEVKGVIDGLVSSLEGHSSLRFKRVLDKMKRVLNEEGLFDKPVKGQPLTGRQRHLHSDLINYLGEISFFISAAVHAKKNGWSKPNMLEEAGTIDLRQVYHPPTALAARESVLNDILITPEKSFYALTGPNSAGKSTTARAIGYSVVFAHLGLFVPAGEANISWMENIYSLYPKEEAAKSGFSHFTRIINLITQWHQNASERDLFLLDEPISGSDYPDLVGIATTIYEDFIIKKATVVTATHNKDSIRLLANHPDENIRNRVQPWINSFDIKEGELDPHYVLVPGIAKESHALASIKKIGMDSSITKMAQMYYDLIANGISVDQGKLKEIIEGIHHWPSSSSEDYDFIPWEVLDELFPAKNFAFVSQDKYDDFVMKAYGQSKRKDGHYDVDDFLYYATKEGEFCEFPFAGGLKDRTGYKFRFDFVGSSDPNERLKIVGKLVQVDRDKLEQLHEKLKELVEMYTHFRRAKIKGQVSESERITQEQCRDMFSRMSEIIEGIRVLLRDPHIINVLLKDEYFDMWLGGLPDLSQDLSQNTLEKEFKASIEQAGRMLQGVDAYLGMAIGTVDNKLSKPKVLDEEGKLKIDSGWYPLVEAEDNISQDFELISAVNVFIGPNASGKTNAFRMITTVMKLAALGFWVPAKNVELSRGFEVGTYFGARDYNAERFSYFESALRKIFMMVKGANKGSFVVFDEISGTDHLEMTAIQMALLTYLKAIGATVILNTHLHEGLKELQDVIGLNVYRMDYDFIEETREFDFKRSISLDREAKAKSHGLEVATHYGLTEDQYRRAKAIAGRFESAAPSLEAEYFRKGGVDFNSDILNIQTQGKGEKFNVFSDSLIISDINIKGYSPVIFQVMPTNADLFLETE